MIFTRTVALDDISIRAGGDGRTVTAYAAIFDTPVEVADQQGRYREQIAKTAFNKTLADKGTRFGVFYNHAMTIQGTPSERASIPIGTPLEVTADARGLLTVTRYNRTPLADEILAAIENGDITAQSFSGRFIGSNPAVPKNGFRPDPKTGDLPLVTRSEIALREYGPTPIPVYQDAAIMGVRSSLTQESLARLLELATRMSGPDQPDTTDPVVVTEAPLEHADRSLSRRVRAAMVTRGMTR